MHKSEKWQIFVHNDMTMISFFGGRNELIHCSSPGDSRRALVE